MVAQGIKAESYTGTMQRHGVKMEYSFSGGKVTKKDEPVIGGAPYAEMLVNIEGEVKSGTTVTASCKKMQGLATFKEVTISTLIHTDDGQIKEDVKKDSRLYPYIEKAVPYLYQGFDLVKEAIHDLNEPTAPETDSIAPVKDSPSLVLL